MKMIRRVYHATEVDPPQEPGWYYHYEIPTNDPLEVTAGEEHGPFTTRDEAVDDACAGQPHNWQVIDESELSG